MTVEKIQSFQNQEEPYQFVSAKNALTEQKAYQLPLQFSDKFFDDDPGLIKIVTHDNVDQERMSRQSMDFIKTNLNLLESKQQTPDEYINILQRAKEITQCVDSQFQLTSRTDPGLIKYEHIFNSPSPNAGLKHEDTYLNSTEEVIVRAQNAIGIWQKDQSQYLKGSFLNKTNQQQDQQNFSQLMGSNTNYQLSQSQFQDIGNNMGYEIVNGAKNFQERNAKWSNQSNQRKSQIQQQMEEKNLKECSFKPKTNENSQKMVSYKRKGPQSNRNEILYEQNGKKVKEAQQQHQINEELRLKQECTFQPSIVQNGFQVQSRYRQIAEELIQNKMNLNDLYQTSDIISFEQSQMKECTFQPKIQGLRKGMQTAQIYTSINAFERLSKPLNQLLPMIEGEQLQQDQQNLLSTQNTNEQQLVEGSEIDKVTESLNSFGQQLQIYQNFNQYQKTIATGEDQLSSITSKSHLQSKNEILTQFSERQNKFLSDKEGKMKKMKEEQEFQFQPKINEKSKTIVQETCSKFVERNYAMLQNQKIHQQNIGKEELNQCTFQPKITKLGQQQRQKDNEERSYGDFLRKQKTIDYLSAETERDLGQVLTFKPKLIAFERKNEFADIKSKLNVNDGLDQLIERIKLENERKTTESENIKRLREEIELLECTHQPKTTELPDYIRRIAEESKKIRTERNFIESLLPIKQDWKQ